MPDYAGGLTVQAPAKINIHLSVGHLAADGYHPVATVYQAVDLFDRVRLTPGRALELAVVGPEAAGVPQDERNLAWQAALLVAQHCGRPATVSLEVHKNIPVAAGLAGGSADAAAVLIGLDALWGLQLPASVVLKMAAALGSDVAFALHGGTALGTGRGERLTPAPGVGLHWVLCLAGYGLSTASSYRNLDEARAARTAAAPVPDCSQVLHALGRADRLALSQSMGNDLQPEALRMAPDLGRVLVAARACGAVAAQVSGSGPTVAVLAHDAGHAEQLAADLAGHCRKTIVVRGDTAGARVCSPDEWSLSAAAPLPDGPAAALLHAAVGTR